MKDEFHRLEKRYLLKSHAFLTNCANYPMLCVFPLFILGMGGGMMGGMGGGMPMMPGGGMGGGRFLFDFWSHHNQSEQNMH